MTLLSFLLALALGFGTGACAGLLAAIASTVIEHRRAQSRTETFEVRSQAGKFRVQVPKNATPEETQRAVEEIRRIGQLAQQHPLAVQ